MYEHPPCPAQRRELNQGRTGAGRRLAGRLAGDYFTRGDLAGAASSLSLALSLDLPLSPTASSSSTNPPYTPPIAPPTNGGHIARCPAMTNEGSHAFTINAYKPQPTPKPNAAFRIEIQVVALLSRISD